MIAIIDYGAGNVKSVKNAFAFLGYDAKITSDISEIENANAVVLPGVGAFSDVISALKKNNVDKVINSLYNNNVPFLGICVGLQALFNDSEESPGVSGLSLFDGHILKIPDKTLKVPQIGWNNLCIKNEDCPLFKGIKNGESFYFVHSYYLKSTDKSIVAATTEYGVSIDACIYKDNFFAVQFHPEKSGDAGLLMLDNFAAFAKEKKI